MPALVAPCTVLSVMDTAPAKQIVMEWAVELLPSGRFYVGLSPVINPAYLNDTAFGLDAAHPDLFKDGLLGIVAARIMLLELGSTPHLPAACRVRSEELPANVT